MNKKLNFFEKIYCGWIHIIHLFALWKEIVFKTDGSQSEVFFMFIQSDYIEYVELTWWRGQIYNKLGGLMNYNMLGMYKRPMKFLEKLLVGWRQILDNRWEWWYHLTETPPELNFEFWMMLNQDMVKYYEEMYYNGDK